MVNLVWSIKASWTLRSEIFTFQGIPFTVSLQELLALVKKNKYVSQTMEFELELVFFDVLLILLVCFFVEWMHSWLLLSTFCTNLFRCDQVGA